MDGLSLLAEFFGTFILIMAVLTSGNALVIGLVLAFDVWVLGGISGSHVNPAVSLAMLLKGAVTGTEFLTYSVIQFTGAVAAYYAYSALV